MLSRLRRTGAKGEPGRATDVPFLGCICRTPMSESRATALSAVACEMPYASMSSGSEGMNRRPSNSPA